jgi:hypothetical protein
MSSKQKLAVVKKSDPEAEFEALLRETAEQLNLRGPQIVRKTQAPQTQAPRHARIA